MGLTSWFQSIDMLGVPITMTFKGSQTHGTAIGGCLSMLASLFILSYAIMQL